MIPVVFIDASVIRQECGLPPDELIAYCRSAIGWSGAGMSTNGEPLEGTPPMTGCCSWGKIRVSGIQNWVLEGETRTHSLTLSLAVCGAWTIPPSKRISCDGSGCVGHPATLSGADDGLVICAAAPLPVAPSPVAPFLARGATSLASARFRQSLAGRSCSRCCLSGSESMMNLVDSEIADSMTTS